MLEYLCERKKNTVLLKMHIYNNTYYYINTQIKNNLNNIIVMVISTCAYASHTAIATQKLVAPPAMMNFKCRQPS